MFDSCFVNYIDLVNIQFFIILSWYVYILECNDNSLYTGITNNLDKRITAHNSGKGAKYTKTRAPVRLVYKESYKTRKESLKREIEIKRLKRIEKLALIN